MDPENVMEKVVHIEAMVDQHEKDIHELKQKNEVMYKLATSVELIAQDMSYLKNDVQSIKKGQEEIFTNIEDVEKKVRNVENADMKKEAKAWENIKEKMLWLVVGGFATMILTEVINLLHIGIA